MTADRDSRPNAEEILAQWFLANEAGEQPDLLALCHGDAELEQQVRQLIEAEPDIIRESLAPRDSTTDHAIDGDDTPLPPIEALPLQRIDDYRLLRFLGRGGMGAVYLARQESLGRTVALKLIGPGQWSEPRTRSRFHRAAELTAGLEHPGIVPVYATGEAEGFAFMAMRYIEGPGLHQLPLPLPPRRCAEIGAAIAEALETAHVAGVVHRDVKPSNVLIDGDRPVLVDFGLARGHTDGTVTTTGSVPGTLPYVAPELLTGSGPRLDPRVDLYGLGATLYELLAGHPPFVSGDPERLVTRIVLEEPPVLRLAPADRDLGLIVLTLLAKRPEHRPQTAAAVAQQLRQYLRGDPVRVRGVGLLPRLWRRARRNPRTTAAIAAGVLALSAAAVTATLQSQRAEQLFADRLARANTALIDGRPDRALETLRGLTALWAGDDRFDALRRRALAANAVERLLDTVVQPIDAVDAAVTRHQLQAVAATQPTSDAAHLAMAFAHVLLGDFAAAEQCAALGRGAPRGQAALRAWLAGPGAEWELPPAGGRSADEHLLTVAVCRLASRPIHELLSELEAAQDSGLDRGGATRRRTHYLLAAVLQDAGQHEASRALLQAMADELDAGPTTSAWSRILYRNLARSWLVTGDTDRAAATLQRIDRDRWSPLEVALDFVVHMHRRDPEAAVATLDRATDRFGDRHPPLLRARAQWTFAIRRDGEAAFALFEQAIAHSPATAQRELATGELFTRQVDWLRYRIRRGQVRGPDATASLDELHEEGTALLDRLRYGRARGYVEHALARIDHELGRTGVALERLDRALRSEPNNARRQSDLLGTLAETLDRDSLGADVETTLLHWGIETVAGIEYRLQQTTAASQPDILRAAFEFARRASSWRAALRIADLATVRLPDGAPRRWFTQQRAAVAAQLADALDQLDRP